MTCLVGATPVASSTGPDEAGVDFDILRAAVNIVRFEQVKTLAVLKQRLAADFPEATQARIDGALLFWAQRVARTNSHLN